MDFTGKKVLFFSAQAFGIPEAIVATIHKKGGEVDFFDERPANYFLVKALIRINRAFIARYINAYHKRIIEKTKDTHYDYIFFVKGESISETNLLELFRYHKNATTIIYHWDSIANTHDVRTLSAHFDCVYSFDRSDCRQYGYRFLPLFYFDEYRDIAELKVPKKYDMMFVGTTHSDRYRFINEIASQIHSFGGKTFLYFFFQGKIMFYRYKLLHPEMRNVKASSVHFKPVSKTELMNIYAVSNIIIDVQHPKQTGLTMRCLECLGAKKKLITTNADIRNYDFFHPSNILVVDRRKPVVPKDFIQSSYQDIDEDIYRKYSISSWVDYIFSSSEKQPISIN